MSFCCLHWWDNYHFFSSPWCIPTIILVADHNPWPFCSQDSITKTGFHYLTYLLWNLRKHGSMHKGTSHAVHMHRVLCSWAAELHSRQRRKVGPTLGIWWPTPTSQTSSGTRFLWTSKATGGPLRFCVLWSPISCLTKRRRKCSWSQLFPCGLSTLHKTEASTIARSIR